MDKLLEPTTAPPFSFPPKPSLAATNKFLNPRKPLQKLLAAAHVGEESGVLLLPSAL
jgi:hypothetical protein